ncbi:hypothetical protein Naga_100318g5 [Nannochloropsis gaditana]|uniref:Uncharacterized protein n=1 Tax=Nannochloropsis gaditana TaxID=72520 RepID=W7TP49_9STRA|nr:hypothetical protein Naga_100318g5 [Nannochloropsis gaditana]
MVFASTRRLKMQFVFREFPSLKQHNRHDKSTCLLYFEKPISLFPVPLLFAVAPTFCSARKKGRSGACLADTGAGHGASPTQRRAKSPLSPLLSSTSIHWDLKGSLANDLLHDDT